MKIRKRKKSNRLAVIIFMLLVLALLFFKINDLAKAVSPISQEINITISPGSSNQQIAKKLAENKLIKSEIAFLLYSKYLGYDKSLKAGNYILDSAWSLPEILEVLSKGQVQSITFTIPEGFTVKQIANRLASQGIINEEKFLSLVNSPDISIPVSIESENVEYRLEGYLFPDTYRVTNEMSELDIINMMLNRFFEVYDKDLRDRARQKGLSDHEIITIASMIEKEAKFDEDRALIASVIYNRLEIGMPLQIDATVQFALDIHKGRISYEDLEVESYYNTYKHLGLPPGPISSPGKASIYAALHPAETDFFYYLAKSDGTHVFNKTFAEHKADKQKYIK
jgi:UPF0755 protein